MFDLLALAAMSTDTSNLIPTAGLSGVLCVTGIIWLIILTAVGYLTTWFASLVIPLLALIGFFMFGTMVENDDLMTLIVTENNQKVWISQQDISNRKYLDYTRIDPRTNKPIEVKISDDQAEKMGGKETKYYLRKHVERGYSGRIHNHSIWIGAPIMACFLCIWAWPVGVVILCVLLI